MFAQDGNRLIYRYDKETLWVEPWGENSLRVRSTRMAEMPAEDWALLPSKALAVTVAIDDAGAMITNGDITAWINRFGKLSFFSHGELLLEEYIRNRDSYHAGVEAKRVAKQVSSSLNIAAREYTGLVGGDYSLTLRFEANETERFYGMGQYQQPYLNLKGADLELAHRNSQASVPFVMSSKGYGFLWNNPAVGRASFAKNCTTWHARSAKKLDYWITASKKPADIMKAYAAATGSAPMMPDYAMGFWQCKLRYQTRDELMAVAREYKRRNIPISVIVVDYFHWTCQGDWKFDTDYWPDPEGMVRELNEMGIQLMVSIWPTVDFRSENYREMLESGHLVQAERGERIGMTCLGNTMYFDATSSAAREYVWSKVKQNYYDKGIRIFWLDEAEPEYEVYDYDNYRYHIGSVLQTGNIYPTLYAKAFHDGMTQEGQTNVINLIRCAWAGSQRYGALVWSGDIDTTFEALREQVAAGLSMGLAGIPWWTTDIGGFLGGNAGNPEYRELFARWFEFAAFCPVMRLHGYREPTTPPMSSSGGGCCDSGAPNEVWSYGDEVLEICEKYIGLRYRMKDYITEIMADAHQNGAPVIRPLFYDFPENECCWAIEDQFMFGPDVLVAPVLYAGMTQRGVYLPEGDTWVNLHTGEGHIGGQTVTTDAPLGIIPVFVRNSRVFG